MQTNVWLKYVPIIRILLKKAKTEDQSLALNVSDFERAGIARKSGYKFEIKFSNGRVDNVIIDSPIASFLAQSLLADASVKELFLQNDYTINMNTKFQLTIKQTSANEAPVAVTEAGDDAEA
ncbi:MAG: hypothetical protein JWP69_783 [Flaviaesturariibacter sp.]|nr:hypothetical protein [Flaviaesturariibacter sp.]